MRWTLRSTMLAAIAMLAVALAVFDRVEQSPELYASPGLARADAARRLHGFAPLVVGAGRVLPAKGPGAWGIFVCVGFGFGNMNWS